MTAPARTSAAPSQRWAELLERRRSQVAFALFVLFVLLYPLLDRRFGWGLLGSANPIMVYAMLALGLNIVVGFAGLLDLGYAAFFAIGGYTAAFLTSPSSPLAGTPVQTNFWFTMAISWFVAAVFGVLLGAPTLRLRGDYLAIVTLAFGEIVPRAFLNLEQWTRGSKGINPIGRPFFPEISIPTIGLHIPRLELTSSNQVEWYYLIVAVSALSVFLILRLYDSRIGRAWMAIREDEIAAASMGIDPIRTKLLAFGLGASFSGFAGSIWASMLQVISPEQFDFSVSIMVLSMVILGGMGNVWGVLAGGIAFGALNNIVVDRANQWVHALGQSLNIPALVEVNLINFKFMIFGLSLVLMMALRPEGLFPSAQRRAELHEKPEEEEGEAAEEPVYEAAALEEPPTGVRGSS